MRVQDVVLSVYLCAGHGQPHCILGIWLNSNIGGIQSCDIVDGSWHIGSITSRALWSLEPRTWLNDDAVNAALSLEVPNDVGAVPLSSHDWHVLQEAARKLTTPQSHLMNMWSKYVIQRIVMPINVDNFHWVGIGVWMPLTSDDDALVMLYDPAGGGCTKELLCYIHSCLHYWLVTTLGYANKLQMEEVHKPMQQDGTNCGVFVVYWLREVAYGHRSRDAVLREGVSFDAGDIDHLRAHARLQLASQALKAGYLDGEALEECKHAAESVKENVSPGQDRENNDIRDENEDDEGDDGLGEQGSEHSCASALVALRTRAQRREARVNSMTLNALCAERFESINKQFWSEKDAVEWLNSGQENVFRFDWSKSAKNLHYSRYSCRSHVSCKRTYRICRRNEGANEVWVEMKGLHNLQQTNEQEAPMRPGVAYSFRNDLRKRWESRASPEEALNALAAHWRGTKLENELPTLNQVCSLFPLCFFTLCLKKVIITLKEMTGSKFLEELAPKFEGSGRDKH